MRKPVTLGIIAISCLIALLANGRVALAQAGSIGGTVGKTDKSASGGEASEPLDHRGNRTKVKTKQNTFQNPVVNGLRVDWCLAAARGCGLGSC